MVKEGDIFILTSLNHSPIYRHCAVLCDGMFYHFSSSGMYVERAEDLLIRDKREIRTIRRGTQTKEQMLAYYQANKDRKYNYLTYNCEHFAYGMATGKEQSPTVRGMWLVVAIVITYIICKILTFTVL